MRLQTRRKTQIQDWRRQHFFFTLDKREKFDRKNPFETDF